MKTHLLTKKRALISSVAMLLVAIIALGTATFAWFTKSTSTSADGLNVRTTKVSELKISKSDHIWTDQSIHYEKSNTVLVPATTADGQAWFMANALKKTEPAADPDTIVAADGAYVFQDQLNVQNASTEGKNMRVTITVNNLTNKYGRVALVPAKEDTPVNGISNFEDGAKLTDHLFDTDGETVQAFTNTEGATSAVTASATHSFVIDSIAPQEAKYFNLYVWFEGQDKQCIDTNSGQAIGNITINVTGSSVD